jgi:hypothetical protein
METTSCRLRSKSKSTKTKKGNGTALTWSEEKIKFFKMRLPLLTNPRRDSKEAVSNHIKGLLMARCITSTLMQVTVDTIANCIGILIMA